MRFAYLLRLTKYWIGPAVFLHMILASAVLFASAPARALVQDYLIHLAPLVLADLWIRSEALRLHRHPSVPNAIPLRALLLIFFTWPVYSLAWLMALLRRPLAFRPTPKGPVDGLNPALILPQCLACLVMVAGMAVTLISNDGLPVHYLIIFVAMQTALQLPIILVWLWGRYRPFRQPAPAPGSHSTLLEV
jgi:hypothetical protein